MILTAEITNVDVVKKINEKNKNNKMWSLWTGRKIWKSCWKLSARLSAVSLSCCDSNEAVCSTVSSNADRWHASGVVTPEPYLLKVYLMRFCVTGSLLGVYANYIAGQQILNKYVFAYIIWCVCKYIERRNFRDFQVRSGQVATFIVIMHYVNFNN